MATPSAVKRGLLCRVPGLSGAWTQDGLVPIIHLVPDRGADTAKLIVDARAALREIVPAGVSVNVQIAAEGFPADQAALTGVHRFAALASDLTTSGLLEGVVKLVPELGRLVLEEGLGVVRFLVADVNGDCPVDLQRAVFDAVHALGSIGISYEVAALAREDARNDLRRPGFFVPAHSPRLLDFRACDEAHFERRLRLLVDDSKVERVPLLDDLDGEKIFSTIGLKNGAPVGTFLPIYDRIYLMMSPGEHQGDDDYYVRNYGISEKHLLAYVRAKKIIPIFKFELGVYPEQVWRRFIEDLSLPFITAREFDYASARYAWSSAEWVRILREDRNESRTLFELLRNIDDHNVENRVVADVIRWMIDGAVSFEGVFWRRGHLSAGHYSPAMPLAKLVHHSVPFHSQSMVPIEVEGAAMHLSQGQAIGAATCEGLVQNERLLDIVAQCFGADPSNVVTISQGNRLREVLNALELAHSDDIPPDEYMDIVDESNTRRIRSLVATLIRVEDGDKRPTDMEVRERVQLYNDGVRRLTRKALPPAEVSMVTGGAPKAFGAGWLASLLGGQVATRVGRSIDATKAGDALDWLRGKLHGIPRESIRLYKIRTRLDQARCAPPAPSAAPAPSLPRLPMKHTILFVAANPLGTDRLALDREARAIQLELDRSGFRDRFELVTRWAAEPLDLLRALRKLKPTIIHFSGHATAGATSDPSSEPAAHRDVAGIHGPHGSERQHGLFFQGPDGGPQLVSTAALEETFRAAGASVKLVVLSACYSDVQARALLTHVGCVVGMSGAICEDAARTFAIGFYGGLGDRESIATAYRQGCAAISLEGLPDRARPQLAVHASVDASKLVLAA